MNSYNGKRKIYFEKQSNDRLCGLHCLNSLLQGPFFDVVQLSEIALDMDKQESLLLGGNSSVKENVDEDGNYNFQVLSVALSNYGASVHPLKAKEIINLLSQGETIQALIFNSSTHWFSIRSINGVWYDLNSTNKEPKVISDFYLDAFIQGSEDIGYTNFLVKNLPALPDEEFYLELQNHQLLFTTEEINKIKENQEKEKSLKEKNKDDEKDNKFKAFQGKGTSLLDDDHNKNEQYDDEEMKQAMEMSLNIYIDEILSKLSKEPEENDKESYQITFRFEDKLFSRRFLSNTTIRELKSFSQINIKTFKEIELSESFPRKIYFNDNATIKEECFSKRHILNCKILN